MTDKLFSHKPPVLAATRQDALDRLEAFLPVAGRYSRDRNHVVAGHTNVSRLSPAIRHRLILESECVAAMLRRYSAIGVEKFIQEVYWRRYWKSWLSLRPHVWTEYIDQLAIIQSDPKAAETRARAERCEAGESSVAIMNHFARELVGTGYLHNHARMWFAGWWVHIERLPWQLGANFFFRHLLDGDPASNTLSWRWVAGLQTPGKTYLPRRSNLEKYLPPEVLESHQGGLEHLEEPVPLMPTSEARPEISRPVLPPMASLKQGRTGIWIHEEDLFIEQSPIASLHPCAILAMGDTPTWTRLGYPEGKVSWLRSALNDSARRAGFALGVECQVDMNLTLTESVLVWAAKQQLQQVVAMRPEVGPLDDQIHELRAALTRVGIDLLLFDRPEDLAIRSLATGGFFGFWEKVRELGWK
jgi:deoxyribodipyrimidine photo-lyase